MTLILSCYLFTAFCIYVYTLSSSRGGGIEEGAGGGGGRESGGVSAPEEAMGVGTAVTGFIADGAALSESVKNCLVFWNNFCSRKCVACDESGMAGVWLFIALLMASTQARRSASSRAISRYSAPLGSL